MSKIEALLDGRGENYVFPFFWQHGEPEQVLRKYMEVIERANCRAVCVESRPHPDFCGPKWWRDMDIILDEARKRDMKVWILDDSHFPTGYANGAVKGKPDELRRQSVYTKCIPVRGKKKYHCSAGRLMKKIPATRMWKIAGKSMNRNADTFDDDRILDAAVKCFGAKRPQSVPFVLKGDRLEVMLPEGAEKLYLTFLTRNAGIHRDYMNMMSADSCRLLLDSVYEPHYEHYGVDFGKTIAGFFSDEPELGNGVYFTNQVKVGNDFDMPWSAELEECLKEKFGEEWKSFLPLLYDDSFPDALAAQVRLIYMDQVTRLVEKNFSIQIGDWCQAHGVEYIGHIIEDNNQHCRTGASLGHYFRAMSGQDMAGIDDIGGQVIPFQEDAPARGIFKWLGGRDGEFYHFCLGALGASYAAIDPGKKGRCMCEIFGNYGWSEGPRMEKYLVDHFMVQGVNRFVPHAFSPKEYPDPDCPPHFYANGNNPQYRAFGKLMAYTNRICGLLSDGKAVCDTAVLYQGEQEWMGETMPDQKVLRLLMENQVTAHVVPCDVFAERERYGTRVTADGLMINGNLYSRLIIPKAEYITFALAKALEELTETKMEILFAEDYPENVVMDQVRGIQEGAGSLLLQKIIGKTRAVPMERLIDYMERRGSFSPENRRIRFFHYIGDEEVFSIVNEDENFYEGILTISKAVELYRYDPWENEVLEVQSERKKGETRVGIRLRSGESLFLIAGKRESLKKSLPARWERRISLSPGAFPMQVSACRAADYPNFGRTENVKEQAPYSEAHPGFSGFIAYEIQVGEKDLPDLKSGKRIVLRIEHAGEDVEVFVNGKSAGIQVLPPFYYDITALLHAGPNVLRMEVATTLERERGVNKKKQEPTGIWGRVELLLE